MFFTALLRFIDYRNRCGGFSGNAEVLFSRSFAEPMATPCRSGEGRSSLHQLPQPFADILRKSSDISK